MLDVRPIVSFYITVLRISCCDHHPTLVCVTLPKGIGAVVETGVISLRMAYLGHSVL